MDGMSSTGSKLRRTTLAAVAIVAGLSAAPTSASAAPVGGLQRMIDCMESAYMQWEPTSVPNNSSTGSQLRRCAVFFAADTASAENVKGFARCVSAAVGTYQPIGGFEGVAFGSIICAEQFLGYDVYVDPGVRGGASVRAAAQRVTRRTRSHVRSTRSR